MNTPVAALLIAALLLPHVPLAAQVRAVPTAQPGTRALLGMASQQASGRAVRQQEWSRVTRLSPGSEVRVIIKGAPAVPRYLLQADDSGLTLLNLTSRELSPAVRTRLRRVAARHPDYFGRTPATNEVVDSDVRLSPAGVFVDGQRVAGVEDLVERFAPADVIVLHKRSLNVPAQVAIGAGAVVLGTLLIGCVLTGAICGG